MSEQDMREQLVEKINQLYISFRKRYVLSIPGGSMFTPKKNGDLHSVLTNGVIRNHLDHKYAVAIYAGPKTSKFLCFDVDDGKPESVRAIIDYLECLRIPRRHIYVSYSGGKGYHVELFFDELVYSNVLRGLYDMVIEGTGLDSHKVEFRPTHGNAIKLPLSVHAKTGNICWFVDRETLTPIKRDDYLMEIEQIPAALINRIVPIEYSTHAQKTSRAAKVGETHREESVPDEETLREPGTRHNHMRKIAVYQRMAGHSRAQCRSAL